MSDANTSVQQLRDQVEAFVAERQWHIYHAPKNLSMALAIEAAELMEHFQWVDVEASRSCDDATRRGAIADELADVICYALAMANALQIDVASTLHDKMEKNRAKYPADRYQGNYE